MENENLEKKHNIIMLDEDFIGTVKNLKEYFIDCLAYNLTTDEDIDDKISSIDMLGDILKKLQELYDNTVIRICYNPMGTYFINDSLDK